MLAYHPGLSYFAPAIPRRPVDRCPFIKSFTNFVPTNFTFVVLLLLWLWLVGGGGGGGVGVLPFVRSS